MYRLHVFTRNTDARVAVSTASSAGGECAGSPPGTERGRGRRRVRGRGQRRRRGRGREEALGVAPSLRVLALADAVRLQLVVDEVVLGLATLAAVLAGEPLVAVGLRVHIEHMLAQVGGGGVDAAAERTLRSVARRPAREGRPCNTEAAVRTRSDTKRRSGSSARTRASLPRAGWRARAFAASRRGSSSCVSACTGAS